MFGEENNGSYNESIARFEHVKYLDISKNDGIFTQSNLNLLYDTFADGEALVYLYEDHSKVGFDVAREISYVNELALKDSNWKPYGGNIVDYRNNNTNGLSHSTIFNGFNLRF